MRLTIVAAAALALTGCSRDRERRVDPLVQAAIACTKDAELSCPRPIFRVENLRASQAYYRDKLGFKLDWDHGEPADFGSVSRGEFILFLCEQCQGHPGAWSMTFAREVDRLHEELVRRGATIIMPPTDMPWGLRELHVADLDGNVIRLGSHGH